MPRRRTQPETTNDGQDKKIAALEKLNNALTKRVAIRHDQLRRLLKAENYQQAGVISRWDLHKIAERIRFELQYKGDADD